MKRQHLSNYEKLCEEWRERFLQLDQSVLLSRIPGLRSDGDYFLLTYYGREYRISRKSGEIVETGQRKVPSDCKMNIYGLFWYAHPGAALLEQWVPFRSLKNASPFAPAFETNVLKPFAMTFEGHLEELHHAAEKLGGERLPQGDAGYQICSFSCIPIQFLFWDKDEEFPAQANILFDFGVTDYIHVESTVSLAVDCLLRLAEEAGLPVKGKTYVM